MRLNYLDFQIVYLEDMSQKLVTDVKDAFRMERIINGS